MAIDIAGSRHLLTTLDRRDPAYSSVFADTLSLDGASVSTLGSFLGNETLSATDDQVVRVDELQFDLGEGPCWDAMALGRPVLTSDMRDGAPSPWPALSSQISPSVRGLYAFPLVLGPLRIGAVDMYSTTPEELGDERVAAAGALAAVVSRVVLRGALREVHEEYRDDNNDRYSRRAVHQATGMVFAQLSISVEDALLVLEGHAFASSRALMEVAEDVIAGRISFSTDGQEMRADHER